MFTHTCTFQAHNAVTNAIGEPVSAGWSNVLTAVPCRLVDNSRRVSLPQSADVTLSPFTLLVPANTAVLDTYRVGTVTTPDGDVDGPFRIADAPIKRRDGRGRVRHISMGLERTDTQ